ncbi:Na+/proline symporter [Aquibacillus albus]|uniref:Na+/proline symporter n=2 Tax=Aquibacillus albus TaxID=1168171 RepID=A0ABS2MVX2_9BACI|nr:Na+/proline symporter [Aquibacillus albus]
MGIGIGIVSLLARWITGNTIFSSPEAIIKYGIFGGIGYALMGVIALMVFGKLGLIARKDYPGGKTLGDYLYYKLHPAGYWLMIGILIILSISCLIGQGIGAGILLNIFFDMPLLIGLIFSILFCIVYAGIGGAVWIQRLEGFQVFFIFTAAIFIPVYYFIQEGVENIYLGIQLYHPYLLILNNYESLFYVFTGMIIGFGQIISDLVTWQRLYMIKKKKVIPTFLLAGLIWFAFPLAFSSFFMIVIFTGGFDGTYSLWLELSQKLNSSSLLITIFFLCAFSAITSTYGAVLHSLIGLIVKNVYQIRKPYVGEKEKIKTGHTLSLFIGGLSITFILLFDIKNIKFLFFFGDIFAAIIAPILVIIFSRGKVDNFIPFSSLIGFGVGYCSQLFVGELYSVWISAATSFLSILVYILFKKANKVFKSV